MRRTLWNVLVLLGALTAPAHAQSVDQLRRAELEARSAAEGALAAFRRAEADGSEAIAQRRQEWVQAEASYRRAVAARVIVAASDGPLPADLTGLAAEAAAREARMREAIAAHLEQRLGAASSPERTDLLAGMEATLRTTRLEAEVLAEAARRQRPTSAAQPTDGRGRRLVNATTDRMDALLHRIATTDTNEQPNGRSPVAHEVEMWLREREREVNLEEYQRLARHGTIISERTQQPITGPARERLARDAEDQLSKMVASHARDKKWLDLWSNADSRKELARDLEARVSSATEYRALAFLAPGEETMPQYYRALALAVRRQQSEVDEWYTGTYLGQTEADARRGALGARVNAWWNTGFGTLARTSDFTGETSDAYVRARLDAMRGETDAAAEALMAAAATADPARLSQRHQDLLRAHGYIERDPAGRPRYTLPSEASKLSGLTRAELPGSSVLDVLSVETLAVTAASVAVPELAAARAAAWAGRVGYSARAAGLITKATGVAASAGVDMASQLATTGTVDFGRTALDNLLLGPATGKLADLAGEAVSVGAGRVLRDTRLARALRDSGNGKALMHQAEALVRAATGITSEAALQTYIDSVLKGNPSLSREDVLANMTTGALAKFMGGSRRNPSGDTSTLGKDRLSFDEAVARHAPPSLRELLVARSPLALEERTRVEALDQTRREAWQRFDRIIPDGAEIDLARVNEAVLRGDFSWSDLKTIAADAPEFRVIHEKVAEAREAFYDDVEVRARAKARAELDLEHGTALADLRRSGLPEAELAARELELKRGYDAELALIEAKAARLGSKAASSDIDRSWISDRVRRAAKEVQDELLYRRDSDLPGPTSARAYDLNEYYNVMPFVQDNFAKGFDLSRERGITVNGIDLNHGEAMSASGLAAAMLHMDPAQRERFERNRLERATPEQRAKLEAQFSWARRSLDEQTALLAERARKVAESTGRDPNDVDVRITARDQLYGERTAALQDLERRIDALPDKDGREAHALRAQWEHDMSVGLREGIETYSQSAGLDLIINRLQAEGKKPGPLLADDDFTIQGRLAGKYTPEQLDAMVNDQSMFLVEHLNGYRHGHESAETAARAIGKYGERALLGLHVKGDLKGLPKEHPLVRFKDIAQELVARKDNPQATREYLATLDPSGDPDKGLRVLMGYVEQFPGLAGINEPVLPDGPATPEQRHAWNLAREAARRRWRAERAEARLFGGPEAELALIERERSAAATERAELSERATEQARLDGRFLRADQPRARRLETELAALQERLHNLAGGAVAGMGLGDELRQEIEKREGELNALNQKFVAAGSPDQKDEADRTRARRIAALEARDGDLERDAVEAAKAAEAARERRELVRTAEMADGAAALDAAELPTPPDAPALAEGPRPMPDGAGPGEPRSVSAGGLELRIARSRYRIGAPIEVAYRTPEDPDWRLPVLSLRDASGKRVSGAVSLQRGAGTAVLPAAITVQVGARITAEREDGSLVAELPVDIVATPAPGAIRLSGGTTHPLGAKVDVVIAAPEDFYYRSAWLGLFRTGEPESADMRIETWHLRSLAEALSITLPAVGGDYELRLFDRGERFYLLDAVRLRVVVKPAPGALRLSASELTFGESFAVAIEVPEGVHFDGGNAWVGLYDLNRSWNASAPPKLGSQWVRSRTQSLTFQAPTSPGTFELRLFDRNGDALLLDAVSFTVAKRTAPDALTLDGERYRIGQPVIVDVNIPEDVYIAPGGAHVSLFAVPAGDGLSGPIPRRRALHREWVSKRTAQLTFQPPPDPGRYALRLYDRQGDHVVLAERRFTVEFEAPPADALSVSPEVVFVGAPFAVQLNIPDEIYVDHFGQISLHPLDQTVGAASSSPAVASRWFRDVGRRGRASFEAPETPGDFEVRFTDREGGMLLAAARVRVVVPEAPGALQIAKAEFRPGEAIDLRIALPEGVQLFMWAKVVLTAASRPGYDPRPADRRHLQRVYVDRATSTASLSAPNWPGRYVLELFDRDATYNRLDRLEFAVVAPESRGALSAPEKAGVQQSIELQYAFPEGVYRERWARVVLVAPRRAMPGGAWQDLRIVRSADLPAERSGKVTLTMPADSGRFELWLLDRPGGLVVDRRTIIVE